MRKRKKKASEPRKKQVGKIRYYDPKTMRLYRIKRPGTKRVFVEKDSAYYGDRSPGPIVKIVHFGHVKKAYPDRRKKKGTIADRK